MANMLEECVIWIYALKYWVLSYKLELIQTGKDSDEKNCLFTAVLVIGLIFCILEGVASGWAIYRLTSFFLKNWPPIAVEVS
jgi:xanthine/uracil/vitamin C permease (AzgA family)